MIEGLSRLGAPEPTMSGLYLQGKAAEFQQALSALWEASATEAGVSHPAERLLQDALCVFGEQGQAWIEAAYQENAESRPAVAADLLRCLGGLEFGLVGSWGTALAQRGLSHERFEVRDAAVGALELWASEDAMAALVEHIEKEPDLWLANYIRQIVRESGA